MNGQNYEYVTQAWSLGYNDLNHIAKKYKWNTK